MHFILPAVLDSAAIDALVPLLSRASSTSASLGQEVEMAGQEQEQEQEQEQKTKPSITLRQVQKQAITAVPADSEALKLLLSGDATQSTSRSPGTSPDCSLAASFQSSFNQHLLQRAKEGPSARPSLYVIIIDEVPQEGDAACTHLVQAIEEGKAELRRAGVGEGAITVEVSVLKCARAQQSLHEAGSLELIQSLRRPSSPPLAAGKLCARGFRGHARILKRKRSSWSPTYQHQL